MSDRLPGPQRPHLIQKPHLIFVHGGGVGPWMWREQLRYFDRRFEVYTPCLPGHEPGSDVAYISHADAVRSIARQVDLDKLDGEITVVGFSVGGQVAIEFAAAFPDRVARSVVVSSIVSPWRSAGLLAWVAGVAAPLAQREKFARAQAKQLYIPDEDFDAYFRLSRSMAKEALVTMMRANLSFQPPTSFLETHRPVLLMAGSQEQRTLIGGLTRFGASLPEASFELIDGVGHGAPLAKPEAFNESLDAWLQRKEIRQG